MQNFKQTFLFLSAQSYRIVNESTNEVTNEGISLRYLTTDNLDPVVDEDAIKRGTKIAGGQKVVKVALPIDKLPKCKEFPALYDATLKFSVVGDKQMLQVTDIDYVGQVRLTVDKPKAS